MINLVTVVTGPQGCGKTTTIEKLLQEQNKLSHWIDPGSMRPNMASVISHLRMIPDNCVAVLDGVGPHMVPVLKELVQLETIKYRRPYTPIAKDYPRPELVIVTNCVAPEEFGDGAHISRLSIGDRFHFERVDSIEARIWAAMDRTGEPSAQHTEFIAGVLNGGKTDDTERAAYICYYFNAGDKKQAVYEVLANRFNHG